MRRTLRIKRWAEECRARKISITTSSMGAGRGRRTHLCFFKAHTGTSCSFAQKRIEMPLPKNTRRCLRACARSKMHGACQTESKSSEERFSDDDGRRPVRGSFRTIRGTLSSVPISENDGCTTSQLPYLEAGVNHCRVQAVGNPLIRTAHLGR